MFHPNELNPFEDFVFYVNESGRDFTFYLDATSNTEVLSRLKSQPRNDEERKTNRYSFVGEISFLDETGLKAISDSFWEEPNSPTCNYLLQGLRDAVSETSDERMPTPQMLSHPELLNDHDKRLLLPLFAKVLFEATLCTPANSQSAEHGSSSSTEADSGNVVGNQSRSSHKHFFETAFPKVQLQIRRGRGLICLSHAGKYLSVSVRKLSSASSYHAAHYLPADLGDRKERLFSLGEYCDLLYREIFTATNSTSNAHGLLVITGSTNSAKSEITRGLIDLYLLDQEKKDRRHHLVTFEDPIERLYVDETAGGSAFVAAPMNATERDRDYTPREKRKDVGALEGALLDALRQTPSVLFVGETRRKAEWELLLDFAATGHLIVTTAHAGSLVEAMHKIFEARKVKTPADRSEIANKLLGVVHLGSGKLTIVPQVFQAADFALSGNYSTENSLAICPGDRFATAHKLLVDRRAHGKSDALPVEELVAEFNKLMDDSSLHDDDAFKQARQPKEVENLLKRSKAKGDSRSMNRLLLEALYQREIARRRIVSETLFPTLWRRTSPGIAALTSDGLASLLPHRPSKHKAEVPTCLGRRWFVEQLLNSVKELRSVFEEHEMESVREQSFRKAIEWDLQGV